MDQILDDHVLSSKGAFQLENAQFSDHTSIINNLLIPMRALSKYVGGLVP